GGSALFPLGDSWSGLCHADPSNLVPPANALVCNFGYARGQCVRFPDDDGPDAVRFTISRADPAGLTLYFVQERDHHPFAHGPLEHLFVSTNSSAPKTLLDRQAAAYAESYRRRQRES